MGFTIGDRYNRMTLQTKNAANTTTGNGGFSNTADVWVEIADTKVGKETVRDNQTISVVDYTLRVLQPLTVASTDRFIWDGKTLNVQAVKKVGRRHLEILATERQ